MVERKTLEEITLTAEEVTKKFGLVGDIKTFATPTKGNNAQIEKRKLLIILEKRK